MDRAVRRVEENHRALALGWLRLLDGWARRAASPRKKGQSIPLMNLGPAWPTLLLRHRRSSFGCRSRYARSRGFLLALLMMLLARLGSRLRTLRERRLSGKHARQRHHDG